MPLEFDLQGHRGCRGLMPENTIPAMLRALELGVTTLEMDAAFTRDNRIILSHEPFFNHEITTRPGGAFIEQTEEKLFNIYNMTYAETLGYDVGLKPHSGFPRQQRLAAHKPLLEDVIDSVKDYCRFHSKPLLFFNIETKTQPPTDNIYHPAPEEFVRMLMDLLKQKEITDRVIIQSFDFRTLKIVHRDHPGLRTAALIEGDDNHSLEHHLGDLGFVPAIYSPEYSLVNSAMVKECRDRSMKLIPWTVNDSSTIESLKNMGVDGIISDYPDLF